MSWRPPLGCQRHVCWSGGKSSGEDSKMANSTAKLLSYKYSFLLISIASHHSESRPKEDYRHWYNSTKQCIPSRVRMNDNATWTDFFVKLFNHRWLIKRPYSSSSHEFSSVGFDFWLCLKMSWSCRIDNADVWASSQKYGTHSIIWPELYQSNWILFATATKPLRTQDTTIGWASGYLILFNMRI